jgi:tetratricopeptide (TPR) repeat protein
VRKRPYPHTVRTLADALGLQESERAVTIEAARARSGDAGSDGFTHPSALPASLTPLLGREREVEEIAGLLGEGAVRLLTLTGPGCIGKTRLGTEAARRAEDQFPDGVYFMALAPLGNAALVMPTAARALGLRDIAGVPLLEVLCQYLRPKRTLLVLDNFEHVLQAAPEVVELLGSCPDLSVLATSRAPLRVRGELEYAISPLAMPDPNRTPEADEVSRAPASRLLVERAGDASPGFRISRANAAAVAAIGASLGANDAQTAARFGWTLRMYWVLRARQGEGRLLIQQTLEHDGEDLPAQTRARALNALAVCMCGSGDAERIFAVSEESAALFRRAGDRHGAAHAPGMIGFAMLQMGDIDRATENFGEVLESLKEQKDAWTSAHILNHMAVAPLRRGDYPQAANCAEEALALTEQTGDRLAAQTALQILAQAAWASGELEEASRYFQASLWVAIELADRVNAAFCMQGLAAVGELQRAAWLLGVAEGLLEAAGAPFYAWANHDMNRKAAQAAREALGEQVWTAAHDRGRAMTFDEAVAYALGEKAPPP